MFQDDPTGISPVSNEKKPKGRVKKEKVEKEKGEKTDKSDKEKDGLKQTKLTFKKEPKKVRTFLFKENALNKLTLSSCLLSFNACHSTCSGCEFQRN